MTTHNTFSDSRLRAITATRPTGPFETMRPESIELQGTLIVHPTNLCRAEFYATHKQKWFVAELAFNGPVTAKMRLIPQGKDPIKGLHLLTMDQTMFEQLLDLETEVTDREFCILGFFHYMNRTRFDRPCAPYLFKPTKTRLAEGRLSFEMRYNKRNHE
tara:strand:- start:728 stop:1204 length:477 start_codon:yes stop_codon:yes gene_type:complete